jgi:glycosyltransferase involved in cell wall biosynthesis
MFEHRRFHAALVTSRAVKEALVTADLIELQWFEEILMARRLRRLHPTKPIVGVFHDVASQRYAREWRASPWSVQRIVRWARFLVCVLLEWHVMRYLTRAIVFSEKDKAILRDPGRSGRVRVVYPPLDDPGMPDRPRVASRNGGVALFVAAFSRRENHDAAVWLLGQIWPRVLRAVPKAKLVLAGGGVPEELENMSRRTPGVHTTGYMRSLVPAYKAATVAVSPIRLGAGVKFKSVVPMLWGIPVIATRAGAEGIGSPDLFFAVEDDPDNFAAALAAVLRDPLVAEDAVNKAFHFVRQRYTTEAYRRCIRELYGEL